MMRDVLQRNVWMAESSFLQGHIDLASAGQPRMLGSRALFQSRRGRAEGFWGHALLARAQWFSGLATEENHLGSFSKIGMSRPHPRPIQSDPWKLWVWSLDIFLLEKLSR